jgi:hypothetical protein
LPLLVE